MNRKQKKILIRIIITALALIVFNIIGVSGPVGFALYFCIYLVIGYDILRKAGRGIINGRVFDENFLMAVATVGAFALAVIEKSSDYNEAVAVMLFYQIGELFQSIAVGKSRKSISDLMDIRPDYANIMVDGELEQVDPEDVETGSIIIVQPGEKVPIDGIVEEGTSSVNTSALTGESVPRGVGPSDEIISGSINMTGVLKIRTTREFGESTASKILELMEESGSHKSEPEKFITRFARVYTPVVCISALALAVLPPVILLLAGAEPQWNVWIYRALTFLVISCPCALVVSIPLTFFAGIGGAGREGILVKGADYMEALANVKTMVFDKTGTLTKGIFEVNAIHHNADECSAGESGSSHGTDCADCENACSMSEDRIIEYAALAECASSHPISQSLRQKYQHSIDRSRVSDIREISGQGILARVDSHLVAVGNEKLMISQEVGYVSCSHPGTVIHVAVDGEYSGHIIISDMEKPGSRQAIKDLEKCGVERIVMLTGDNENAARKAVQDLGIREYYAGLMPADKVSRVEEMLSRDSKGKLAFAGDGINDAPVLTRADIGIAMGALGSDAAIEAADVVLMDDEPGKIPLAIRISRKCMRIVYQNITMALVVKFVCLILSACGIANMWYAIFADVGVLILAVLNAIRALRVKKQI